MAVIQTAFNFAGIKRETTPGTYAAPAAAQDFLFLTEGTMEDKVEDVFDESYQAATAQQYGYYAGVQQSLVTLKGYVAQASSGHLFRAALGAISESGAADPYTHNFTARTAQGPSYSIVFFDGTIAGVRAVEMARLRSLKLSYSNVKGMFMYEAIFVGKWVDVSQVKMSPTFDTSLHYLPWQGALTYGAANSKLISLTWALENEVEGVPGSAGTQALVDVSQNRLKVAVDAVFVPTDATEYNLFRANTQQAFSIVFTQGTHSLTLQTSKLALLDGTKILPFGKSYVEVQAKAAGINNATDAGPTKIVLLNAIGIGLY